MNGGFGRTLFHYLRILPPLCQPIQTRSLQEGLLGGADICFFPRPRFESIVLQGAAVAKGEDTWCIHFFGLESTCVQILRCLHGALATREEDNTRHRRWDSP